MYTNSRVLIGNWIDRVALEESFQNKVFEGLSGGKNMLGKYKLMCKNLDAPVSLAKTQTYIDFGDTISLLAPHLGTASEKGLLFGSRLDEADIEFSQDLHEGCRMVGYPTTNVTQSTAFVITSADYCDRKEERLKYNQEFILTLASSVNKKPLYVRYDPIAYPGLLHRFPLYLSHNAMSSTRWRILPTQKPDITRFEQEGLPVPVNKDIVVNHCSTNLNLGVNTNKRALCFNGHVFIAEVKTCLDILKCEMPNNIWQIYTPLFDDAEPNKSEDNHLVQ